MNTDWTCISHVYFLCIKQFAHLTQHRVCALLALPPPPPRPSAFTTRPRSAVNPSSLET